MRRPTWPALVSVVVATLVLPACVPPPPPPQAPPPCTAVTPAPTSDPASTILVLTSAPGFRHDSIPAGIQALQDIGTAEGWTVEVTENRCLFTPARLAHYGAVVFLLTVANVLDDTEQSALQDYVESGGGFAGIHSAGDTEHDWPWYGQLIGTRFLSHPAIQPGTLHVEDATHASTAGFAPTWVRTDEWYSFTPNPRPGVHVLLTIDESTYAGGAMGADHPMAWCHAVGTGRSWYTALGHTIDSYAESQFRAHLQGGIEYALGVDPSC